MSALVTWLVAAMMAFAPPSGARKFPGWSETEAEARVRYQAIAEAIEAAALDVNGTGLSDKSEAALLLALALEESALSQDVDVGPCYRGKPGGGWWSRCDGGTSYSVWQLKAYTKADGSRVTGAMLQADRKLAARKALALAVGSLSMCRKLEARDRLSAYMRGTCATGLRGAAARWDRWHTVEAWSPKKP